jgi:hypothetical protein
VVLFIGMAFTQRRFEQLNATVRWTVAADSLMEAILNLTNLLGSTIYEKSELLHDKKYVRFFVYIKDITY